MELGIGAEEYVTVLGCLDEIFLLIINNQLGFSQIYRNVPSSSI